MSPRFDKDWIDGLLDAKTRLGSLSPEGFLLENGLAEGMTVVDYGCGPGLFTMAAANIVGVTGKIYALDIEPKMVALVASRVEETALRNVEIVLNDSVYAQLPDAVADFAICALVLHYFDQPTDRLRVVRELFRLVRNGGCVLVVQRTPSPDKGHHHLTSIKDTIGFLTQVGFETDTAHEEITGRFYTILSSKPKM